MEEIQRSRFCCRRARAPRAPLLDPPEPSLCVDNSEALSLVEDVVASERSEKRPDLVESGSSGYFSNSSGSRWAFPSLSRGGFGLETHQDGQRRERSLLLEASPRAEREQCHLKNFQRVPTCRGCSGSPGAVEIGGALHAKRLLKRASKDRNMDFHPMELQHLQPFSCCFSCVRYLSRRMVNRHLWAQWATLAHALPAAWRIEVFNGTQTCLDTLSHPFRIPFQT